VAVAAALKADVCEIYTTSTASTRDPNVCPNARKVDRISYEEMLELASLGAKVLLIRSVEFGMKYAVPIHVRSSFNDNEGTWVVLKKKRWKRPGVRRDRHQGRKQDHHACISDATGIHSKCSGPG